MAEFLFFVFLLIVALGVAGALNKMDPVEHKRTPCKLHKWSEEYPLRCTKCGWIPGQD